LGSGSNATPLICHPERSVRAFAFPPLFRGGRTRSRRTSTQLCWSFRQTKSTAHRRCETSSARSGSSGIEALSY